MQTELTRAIFMVLGVLNGVAALMTACAYVHYAAFRRGHRITGWHVCLISFAWQLWMYIVVVGSYRRRMEPPQMDTFYIGLLALLCGFVALLLMFGHTVTMNVLAANLKVMAATTASGGNSEEGK